MAFTQLSPIALPGRRYFFAAKDAAPSSGPHAGLFTELSVIGIPGQRHSFVAKAPATPESGPHSGLFTELSVMALPGMRHVFSAKSPYIPTIPPSGDTGGGGGGGCGGGAGGVYLPEYGILGWIKTDQAPQITKAKADVKYFVSGLVDAKWANRTIGSGHVVNISDNEIESLMLLLS